MKYKVGDELLLKGKIIQTDDSDDSLPYRAEIIGTNWMPWLSEKSIFTPTKKVKVPAWFDEWVKEQTVCKSDFESLRLIDDILRNSIDGHTLDFQDQFIFISAIINGYEVEKEKRYVLPMEGTELTDGSMKSKPRIAYLVPDEISPRWNTKALFQATAEKNPTFQVAQSQLDNAPDWVKAIKPVEVEPDENN